MVRTPVLIAVRQVHFTAFFFCQILILFVTTGKSNCSRTQQQNSFICSVKVNIAIVKHILKISGD